MATGPADVAGPGQSADSHTVPSAALAAQLAWAARAGGEAAAAPQPGSHAGLPAHDPHRPGVPSASPLPEHAPGPAPAWAASSAGTLGAADAATLDERGNLPAGVVGFVAALMIVAGVFLPWIVVEGHSVSGWSSSADAKILLALAIGGTVAAALLVSGARGLALRLGILVLGVAAVGVVGYDLVSANGLDDFEIELGMGLFVALAGGIVLALAGLLTRHRRFL